MNNTEKLLQKVSGKKVSQISEYEKRQIVFMVNTIEDCRGRKILIDRYLLDRCKTFKQLSEEIGVSPQRVRQLEQLYLSKLKKRYSNNIDLDSIENLDLTNRIRNALARGGITKISQVEDLIASGKINRIRNLGETSISQLKQRIKQYKNGEI